MDGWHSAGAPGALCACWREAMRGPAEQCATPQTDHNRPCKCTCGASQGMRGWLAGVHWRRCGAGTRQPQVQAPPPPHSGGSAPETTQLSAHPDLQLAIRSLPGARAANPYGQLARHSPARPISTMRHQCVGVGLNRHCEALPLLHTSKCAQITRPETCASPAAAPCPSVPCGENAHKHHRRSHGRSVGDTGGDVNERLDSKRGA